MSKATITEDIQKLEAGMSAMAEELQSVASALNGWADALHEVGSINQAALMRNRASSIKQLLRSLRF